MYVPMWLVWVVSLTLVMVWILGGFVALTTLAGYGLNARAKQEMARLSKELDDMKAVIGDLIRQVLDLRARMKVEEQSAFSAIVESSSGPRRPS